MADSSSRYNLASVDNTLQPQRQQRSKGGKKCHYSKLFPPDQAEGDVQAAYSFFVDGGMPVPKPLEMTSVSPGLIKIQKQVLDYFMNHPTLGFALLSLIRYLVAKQYNYAFCTNFNYNFLKMQGMEDEDIEKLVDQPETAPIEDKDKAMLLFVLKALKTP